MEEVGAAIKEIIHYQTIRGKFSSVHPDLAAEGITRVEVGEEGLHFITTTEAGLNFYKEHVISLSSFQTTLRTWGCHLLAPFFSRLALNESSGLRI